MQATTSARKVRALRGAAEQISRHLKWHKQMVFLQPPALRAWQHYCCVLGMFDGYVVLQVRLGALIREVRIASCFLPRAPSTLNASSFQLWSIAGRTRHTQRSCQSAVCLLAVCPCAWCCKFVTASSCISFFHPMRYAVHPDLS